MLPKTEAAKYADAHSNTTLLPNGKIRFDETGMEFPSTIASSILNKYASGKAFRRAIARRANEAYDFSVHEPHVVPHRNRDERHFLYCTLTRATLPRDRDIVQKHVAAKKFRMRLAEAEEAKKNKLALAAKRREKRERARTVQKPKSEEDGEPVLKQSPEDADDPMEEENDILDGILSDDENGANDEESESSLPKNLKKQRKGKLSAPSPSDDGMDVDNAVEDMAEEKDAFWTRGRKVVISTMDDDEDDEDDDDEWRESSKKSSSKTKTKKKVNTTSAKKPTPNGSNSAAVPEDADRITGKRDRSQGRVPKRIRPERQRRKRQQAS